MLDTATPAHPSKWPSCNYSNNNHSSSPPVLVVGSSIVRRVEASKAKTVYWLGACVQGVKSSALQLFQKQSVSTLVAHAGFNDINFKQAERFKAEFISLIDDLLNTGKQCVIAGLLPLQPLVTLNSVTSVYSTSSSRVIVGPGASLCGQFPRLF